MGEAKFIIQIVLAFFLIGSILLQSKGTGLGQAWGGGGEFYRSKRGVEKILYWTTIVMATIFFFWSVILILI